MFLSKNIVLICLYVLLQNFYELYILKTADSQVCYRKEKGGCAGLETVEARAQIISYYNTIYVSSQKQTKNGFFFFFFPEWIVFRTSGNLKTLRKKIIIFGLTACPPVFK